MPFVFVSKGKDPPRRRKPRGVSFAATNAKREAAMAARVERAFTFDWMHGIKRLRAKVSYDQLEQGFRAGDLGHMMKSIPFGDLPDLLASAINDLKNGANVGVGAGTRMLPDPQALRFDINNPSIQKYTAETQGRLIVNVTEDFQVNVQMMVRQRMARGLRTSDMQGQLKQELKETIGLDPPRKAQLDNFRAAGNSQADCQALEERLFNARAKTIARTEVSFSQNEGQRAVWDAAAEQGLIDRGTARKVWVIEADACQKICLPMEDISVGLDEQFLLPNGDSVLVPPAHPNCRCLTQLALDENDETPGSNMQNYVVDRFKTDL